MVAIRPVVCRSPLEASHARLGARWASPSSLWPLDYGDPASELQNALASAGLAEIGPVAKAEVRGPAAGAYLARVGGSFAVGRVSGHRRKGEPEVWGVAPDQALLVHGRSSVSEAPTPARASTPAPPPASAHVSTSTSAPSNAGAAGFAVVDLSSALTLLRLVGPNAGHVLAELCSLDLAPAAFPDGQLAHAPVANVRITLARIDWRGTPAYSILVARDYALYLWDALVRSGRPHGLSPVGAASIGESPSP